MTTNRDRSAVIERRREVVRLYQSGLPTVEDRAKGRRECGHGDTRPDVRPTRVGRERDIPG